MPPPELWAGALSLLLIHDESGCPHSALHAARLLDRLCAAPDLDAETRALCERASNRLTQTPDRAARHDGSVGGRAPAAHEPPPAGAMTIWNRSLS